MTFREFILLRHAEISNKEWARLLGVESNTISSHWKNGKGGPSFDAIVSAFPNLPDIVRDEILSMLPRSVEAAQGKIAAAMLGPLSQITEAIGIAIEFDHSTAFINDRARLVAELRRACQLAESRMHEAIAAAHAALGRGPR